MPYLFVDLGEDAGGDFLAMDLRGEGIRRDSLMVSEERILFLSNLDR